MDVADHICGHGDKVAEIASVHKPTASVKVGALDWHLRKQVEKKQGDFEEAGGSGVVRCG